MRHSIQLAVRIFFATFVLLLIAGAGCDPFNLECSGPQHIHPRYVNVSGLQDSMKVGDTINVEIEMDWVMDTTINGGTYDLRDLENPDDHGISFHSTHVPLGGRDGRPFEGSEGGWDEAFEIEDIIPRQGEWEVYRGGAFTQGDTTNAMWRASVDLVFSRPGRYYVRFLNTRVNHAAPRGDQDDVIYVNGLTTDDCNEHVFTKQFLHGYSPNFDMINRAERFSDIKLRTGVSNDNGEFYILVFE